MNNKLFLYSRRINNLPDLEEYIGLLGLHDALVIAEYPDDVVFQDFDIGKHLLKDLIRARIFTTSSTGGKGPIDIRIRRTADSFVVVVASEQELSIKFDKSETLTYKEAIVGLGGDTNSGIYLWGKHLRDEEWFESRIPRKHKYPVTQRPKYLRLQVVEYRNDNGELLYSRFDHLI